MDPRVVAEDRAAAFATESGTGSRLLASIIVPARMLSVGGDAVRFQSDQVLEFVYWRLSGLSARMSHCVAR